MPGPTFEQLRRSRARQARPTAHRPVPGNIRVTSVYATPWHLSRRTADGDLPGYLRLWRFEPHYRLSADQLPAVLHRETLDPGTLRFSRWRHTGQLTGARVWLFRLPSGQIAAALSLDVHVALIDTIDLLEDCYFTDIQAGELPLADYARGLAAQLGVATTAGRDFLPERHQLVFDQAPAPGDGGEDLIQRLVYRADLPYRREYSAICYPAELNRRPGWLAAVARM